MVELMCLKSGRNRHKLSRSIAGLTLLELVFTLSLITFLLTGVAFIYVVTLRGWDHVGHRVDIREDLHFALERVTRDVREASDLEAPSHTLMFTLAGSGFIYYLHHASDSCPMAYNQTSYELRRTTLTQADPPATLDCSLFTYGAGEVIQRNLTPPTSGTTITESGNVVALQLQGIREDDTLTVRGQIRPRNIIS